MAAAELFRVAFREQFGHQPQPGAARAAYGCRRRPAAVVGQRPRRARAAHPLHKLDAKQYIFAFWSRVARTAGILAALLFALPFGFGVLRGASLSARTTLGLTLGILYFFLQRLVESGTLVFNLNPLLLAWIPTALLGLGALLLIWRVR